MRLVDPKALARTYAHPSKDPWEAVQLYREAAKRPEDWGSTRVASAINSSGSNEFAGISRSEVRAWVDGNSKPDPEQTIEVARDLGWDADEWTSTTEALATLVIGVYAFGSVTEEYYAPSWSPDDGESERVIEHALQTVGVGSQHVEREDPTHGDEIKPARHIAQLGRALAVAGAPVGIKTAATMQGLPDWVDDTPRELKVELATLFVRGRGVKHENKATRTIQTDRHRRYFEDVAALIEDTTGKSATASDHSLTVSADAVRALGLADDYGSP